MSVLDRIALALIVIGGINWGLVGIFRFDLVAWICGGRRPSSPASSIFLWALPHFGAFPFCLRATMK